MHRICQQDSEQRNAFIPVGIHDIKEILAAVNLPLQFADAPKPSATPPKRATVQVLPMQQLPGAIHSQLQVAQDITTPRQVPAEERLLQLHWRSCLRSAEPLSIEGGLHVPSCLLDAVSLYIHICSSICYSVCICKLSAITGHLTDCAGRPGNHCGMRAIARERPAESSGGNASTSRIVGCSSGMEAINAIDPI